MAAGCSNTGSGRLRPRAHQVCNIADVGMMLRARFLSWAHVTALATFHFGLVGCSSESIAAGTSSPSTDAMADPPDVMRIAEPDAGTITAGGAACPSAPLFPLCADGQILAILAAECASHVDIANAVRANLGSNGALDLAEKIITDDSVLAVQVEGEMRETGIAAAPGGIDRAIAAETQQVIQVLAAESSPALDGAYVDREVLAHLRALALIDRLLRPSVKDPRVGDLLGRVRDLVVQHAQAATQAQSDLEGACASQPD
jgi:predicted outer membrane protein